MTDEIPQHLYELPAKEPSIEELAYSWLDFRTGEVRKQMVNLSKPKPTANWRINPPGSMPAEYRGSGMDESDWRVAELEYEQDMYESFYDDPDDDWWVLQKELDRLDDELAYIEESKLAIKEGDFYLANRFAEKERVRRELIEAERRKKQEAEKGVEFEGVSEMTQDLNELVPLMRMTTFPLGELGDHGWRLTDHMKAEAIDAGGLVIRNFEQFMLFQVPNVGDQGNKLFMRLRVLGEGAYSIIIEDFREPQSAEYGNKPADRGIGAEFIIKDGRVFHPRIGSIIKEYMFGYPETHGIESARRMEQHDIYQCRALVTALKEDVAQLSS
jgi:hypothetical protein